MQVLHVIGPVGAGKTVFLKRFFPTWTLFDIKDVYRLTGGQPADLYDPAAYGQFAAALPTSIAKYLSPKEANLVPKAPSPSIRFVCAHCHADFSKDTYLLKHYDRFPECRPKK